MARRKPYTKVKKSNQIRSPHVKGMGDVLFKGFQCLNPECEVFLFVRDDELGEIFEVDCPHCNYQMRSGETSKFYDYELVELVDKRINPESVIEDGEFSILHDDYVSEAQSYKYCIVCNTMKPLELFDKHQARRTGRQGECRLCKKNYNAIKNPTRLTDQHREAAQKRRMYLDLAGSHKIKSAEIHKRFGYKCFKCGKDLRDVEASKRPLDHTLPAVYLWPLTTENATLLCQEHNGQKSGSWPASYYSDGELRRLSVLTGIPYDVLSGEPHFNPQALSRLQEPLVVDDLITKYAPYMSELIKVRNRILQHTSIDFFEHSTIVSSAWMQEANKAYSKVVKSDVVSTE